MLLAIRSVGRLSSSLTSVTITGVIAAAIQVPAIHRREVTSAAVAEPMLAKISVRMLRRRSSSRDVRGGEFTASHHNEPRRRVADAMSDTQTRDADLVVVGAGLAGLAARSGRRRGGRLRGRRGGS